MPSHAEEWGRNKDRHPIRPERRLKIMLRAADGECEVGRLLAFALVMAVARFSAPTGHGRARARAACAIP
jgi:hypothetical protein